MLLFLDTADVNEIREIAAWGVLGGVMPDPFSVNTGSVTPTHPKHQNQKDWQDWKQLVKEICRMVQGPVCATVSSADPEGMLKEGRDIATWAENAFVSCPLTPAGLTATSSLAREDIKINVTLCFSVNQSILAARAGATYISIPVGALDDINEDGCATIEQVVEVFHMQGIDTAVIAADIRAPWHVTRAALAGADAAAIPHKVFKQLVSHPLTDSGLGQCLKNRNSASCPPALSQP